MLTRPAHPPPAHPLDLSNTDAHPFGCCRVSVSKRTFGPSSVNVYAWFTPKPQLTKCIWSMAVCQHQFFLDRLQNKVSVARLSVWFRSIFARHL